jgi:signal transduction histidine kinase
MRSTRPKGGRSLQRDMLVIGAIGGASLIAVLALFIWLTLGMRTELNRASDSFTEEQRIADRLLEAVTRQLVAASFYARYPNESNMQEFRAAGDTAYLQIRRYLGRSLTAAQRRQLENVKEQHQQLEVAATESFAMSRLGHAVEAGRAAENMIRHSATLQSTLHAFLAMRERDLGQLRDRQELTFFYLYGAAGLIGIAVAAAGALLLNFLYRRISRPLLELTDAAARVGGGDLAVRVDLNSLDEFAGVAASFNRMTEQLSIAREELIQTEKLSAMGRMMAGLAHELNNPLASVLGYSELIYERLDSEQHPEDRKLRDELVHPLVEQAVRARALVREFLRFSRLPGSTLDAVSVREALQVIHRLRAFSFEQAGLKMMIKPGPDAWVKAEQVKLQQIIINIVNNALDAMAPHGRGTLTIGLAIEDEHVVMQFDDTGPGLESAEHVFEPFFTTKPVGAGTGMGLALVHQFITEAGGTVRAENLPRGGARFSVRLLRAAPEVKLEMSAPVVTPAANIQASPRILIVEDEAPLRAMQERFLKRLDANVLLAAGVEEAKTIVSSNPVDLIISDVKMPGLSGVDFYRWIETERPALVDRFLFVTGDVADAIIADLAAQRPDRVVHKPFTLQEYLERVTSLLAA